MFTHTQLVEVRFQDQTVGALAADQAAGAYRFEYDPAWRARHIELAPLHMPTRGRTTSFVFPNLPEATYYRLPALIADSLPDDFGNTLIDAWMARQGVQASDVTPLDRLAYLGSRGMGALTFHPLIERAADTPSSLELNELVTAARAALSGNLESVTETLADMLAVGTSAGGARAKAILNIHPDSGDIRHGGTPIEGYEPWLLKFDGVGADSALGASHAYGRIEYAYHLMALDAGIAMTESRLLEEGGRAHFLTRRFDRHTDGSRTHFQTLCAMAHLDFRSPRAHDYAQLFTTIDALGLDVDARVEAFRRMLFNILASNCDDHTKNVAFAMDDDGQWNLAPAYDVTYAHNPQGEWTAAHQMGVAGEYAMPTRKHVMELADRFAVPYAADHVDAVASAVREFEAFAQAAGLDEATVMQIRTRLDQVRAYF